MDWLAFPVIASSYFLGAIPLAYLLGRWLRGKDISQAGTGTSGAANVWHSVSRKWGLLVFFADALKGAAGPIAGQLAGLDQPVQVAAGLAVVTGHNWSVFLRFRGGRGIASIVGMMLVLGPREGLIAIAIGLAGMPLRKTAITVLAGIALIPVMGWLFGQGPAIISGEIAIVVLVIAKRLEANRRSFPRDAGAWQVLLYRLLLDRDIRDRKAWIEGQETEDRRR